MTLVNRVLSNYNIYPISLRGYILEAFKRPKWPQQDIDSALGTSNSYHTAANFYISRRNCLYSTLISQLLFRWTEKKYIEASNAGTANKNPKSGRTVMPLNRKPAATKRKNNPILTLDIRSRKHIFFIRSPHKLTCLRYYSK